QVQSDEAPNAPRYKRLKNRTVAHRWCKKDGSTEVPVFQFLADMESCCFELQSPYSYFKSFITEDFLDLLVEQSNLYSVQNNVNKPFNVTKNEMEQLLGLVMYFSLVKMPDTRMHWYRKLCDFMVVAPSVMSRDRFEAIKKYLHMVDNSNLAN
ncbi:PiggyBac transposable element-derived protein, partial [Trinorchestia longiramus]